MDYFTLIMLGLGGFLIYKKFIKKPTEVISEPVTTINYDTTIQTSLATQSQAAAATTNLTIAKDYILFPKAWDILLLSYNSLLQQKTGAFKKSGILIVDNIFNFKTYSTPKKVEFAKDKTYNIIAEAMIKLYPGTKYKVLATEGLLETDAFALNKGYLKVYFFKVQSGRPYPEPVLKYWKEGAKITLDRNLNPFTIVPSIDIIKRSNTNRINTAKINNKPVDIYQHYNFYDADTIVNVLATSKYSSSWVALNPKAAIQTTTESEKEQTALVKQTTGSTNTTSFIRS
ncbi:MAG: hypothetical protein PHU54_02295 [Candidatus Omnitrophica bacterium]|nr:hypothetical protein [Candidatus Omnitrophota bacterium]